MPCFGVPALFKAGWRLGCRWRCSEQACYGMPHCWRAGRARGPGAASHAGKMVPRGVGCLEAASSSPALPSLSPQLNMGWSADFCGLSLHRRVGVRCRTQHPRRAEATAGARRSSSNTGTGVEGYKTAVLTASFVQRILYGSSLLLAAPRPPHRAGASAAPPAGAHARAALGRAGRICTTRTNPSGMACPAAWHACRASSTAEMSCSGFGGLRWVGRVRRRAAVGGRPRAIHHCTQRQQALRTSWAEPKAAPGGLAAGGMHAQTLRGAHLWRQEDELQLRVVLLKGRSRRWGVGQFGRLAGAPAEAPAGPPSVRARPAAWRRAQSSQRRLAQSLRPDQKRAPAAPAVPWQRRRGSAWPRAG